MSDLLLILGIISGLFAFLCWLVQPLARDLAAATRDDPAREAAADAAGLDLDGQPQIVGGPPASDPKMVCHWGCPRGDD
jgi:hypothetical protein